MGTETKLSHTAAMILRAISAGYIYGFSVMEMTGLPSGTVYPAMRRLERDGLIQSKWEAEAIATAEQRPPRKYYKLTRAGKTTLDASLKRYPLLEKLISQTDEEREEWLKEWKAELWHVVHQNAAPSMQQVTAAFVGGAFRDAYTLSADLC